MLDRVVTAVRCAGLSPLRTSESGSDSRAISWGNLRRRIEDCLLNWRGRCCIAWRGEECLGFVVGGGGLDQRGRLVGSALSHVHVT